MAASQGVAAVLVPGERGLLPSGRVLVGDELHLEQSAATASSLGYHEGGQLLWAGASGGAGLVYSLSPSF